MDNQNQSFKEGSYSWGFKGFLFHEKTLNDRSTFDFKKSIQDATKFIEKLYYFGFFYYSNRLNALILRCLNNNKPSSFSVHFSSNGAEK